MAYRSRSRSRRSGARRVSTGRQRGVRRSRMSNRGNTRRSGGSAGRGQTLRIVLEHPASNPMMVAPVGQKVDVSTPARARF